MKHKNFILSALFLGTLGIYFFVSAPPLLPEEVNAGAQIPVEKMFQILQAENGAVRALWTKEFVVGGKPAGLKFDEHWREPNLDAGPLPALLLRDTAKNLTKSGLPLSLFLGSDFPISSSNKFDGVQLEKFAIIKEKQTPQFFYASDIASYTGMFPDHAVNQGCVDCHNNHPDSMKKDWKLNEVMGATTWLYPRASVTTDEIMQNVAALRKGVREAYAAYVAKVQTFKKKPEIGDRWPRDGFYIPSVDVFMTEIEKRNSGATLQNLMTLMNGSNKNVTQKITSPTNEAKL